MNVGQSERVTQNRVIDLFRDELGYRFLGDWTDHSGNSNIEEKLLSESMSICMADVPQGDDMTCVVLRVEG